MAKKNRARRKKKRHWTIPDYWQVCPFQGEDGCKGTKPMSDHAMKAHFENKHPDKLHLLPNHIGKKKKDASPVMPKEPPEPKQPKEERGRGAEPPLKEKRELPAFNRKQSEERKESDFKKGIEKVKQILGFDTLTESNPVNKHKGEPTPHHPGHDEANWKEAFINITGNCNLECLHCYHSRTPRELTKNELLAILRVLSQQGVKRVVLFGGEPMLYGKINGEPDALQEVLTYAQIAFESVSIQTNGTYPHTAEVLSQFNVNVVVSLEDTQPEYHDAIRGQGMFEQTLITLEELKDLNVPVTIRGTILPKNNVLGLAMFAQRKGFSSLFVPFIPSLEAEEETHMVPDSKRLREVYNDIMFFDRTFDKGKGRHRIEHTPIFVCNANELLYNKAKKYWTKTGRGCPAGHRRLFINSYGWASPCQFLQNFKVGNILNGTHMTDKGKVAKRLLGEERKELQVSEKRIKQNLQRIKVNMEKWNDWIAGWKFGGFCLHCRHNGTCGAGCVAYYLHKGYKDYPHCPIYHDREGMSKRALAEYGKPRPALPTSFVDSNDDMIEFKI